LREKQYVNHTKVSLHGIFSVNNTNIRAMQTGKVGAINVLKPFSFRIAGLRVEF
jgi:hypothetical protein